MHDFAFENRSYFGEFEAEFKKAIGRESGAQGVLFDEKNRRSKISWHCPFKRSRKFPKKLLSKKCFWCQLIGDYWWSSLLGFAGFNVICITIKPKDELIKSFLRLKKIFVTLKTKTLQEFYEEIIKYICKKCLKLLHIIQGSEPEMARYSLKTF
jgi:hypothetical protein